MKEIEYYVGNKILLNCVLMGKYINEPCEIIDKRPWSFDATGPVKFTYDLKLKNGDKFGFMSPSYIKLDDTRENKLKRLLNGNN